MKNKLYLLLKIILIAIAALFVINLLLFIIPYHDLNEFLKKPYSLHILDRNGNILQVLPLSDGSRREFVNVDSIPGLVKEIFIKSEDKRFYFHYGVDPVALIRTIYLNSKYKKNISGASTITMQLSRIISPHKQDYYGKIIEMINAVRLEAKLSKKKILELWLNSIPFGYKSFGITSAGKVFFGKEIDELTPAEVLALATIPRSPEKYNTFNEIDNLKSAAKHLKERIKYKISNEDIDNDIKKHNPYQWPFFAPHFINFIKDKIDEKEYSSGLSITTSLDYSLTQYFQNILKEKIEKYENFRITNGAILVLDNITGEVLSYVGSADFNNKINSGEIDGIQITNQPGSTIKPFLYALALEKDFLPSDILPDIPMDFGGEDVYVPLNFNKRFNGPVRFRVALASSLNVPAVYLVTRVGVRNFIDKLLQLDFNSIKSQKEKLGSGIAVGSVEISLYELVRGFSIFPRGGEKTPINWKKQITHDFITGEKVFSDYASFMICDILSDSESRVLAFGPHTIFNTPFPAMFKTGTSNQFNNVWALGATPDYTVGVWMGNFGGETVIGRTGSSVPAEIVVEALKTLVINKGSKEFKICDNLKKEIICPLSGGKITGICPGAVYEYFKKDQEIPDCKFHTIHGGMIRVQYPPLFQSWAKNYERSGSSIYFQDEKTNFPKIIKPKNNAVFYFDSFLSPDSQAIKLEILNNNKDELLNLFVNDSFLDKLQYPYEFYLPVKKGFWVIKVQGNKGSDEISIMVK